MSSTLATLKARNDSRNNYMETLKVLERESSLNLNKFTVADNIDMPFIITEFESYQEVKYGRKPVLIRTASRSGDSPVIKPAPPRKRGSAATTSDDSPSLASSSSAVGPSAPVPSLASVVIAPAASVRSTPSIVPEHEADSAGLSLSGTGISAGAASSSSAGKPKLNKVEEVNERFHNNFLKPLPYELNSELRELAAVISRDIFQDNPHVYWDDVVELDVPKRILKEAVVMPVKYPQLFTGLLTPWKGVLLFGPPGTGKTMLAKAVATECKTTFFNISASSIVSKYRGDSEKLVRILFDLARYHAPSTIFLDEIDALMGQRSAGGTEHEASRRMKTELLIQMDGLARSDDLVFLLAASNLPWDLDSALLRRLEKRVLVPLPGATAREMMLRKLLSDRVGDGVDFASLSARSEGYSGSDIKLLCKEAAMRPLRTLMARLERLDLAGEPGLADEEVKLDMITALDVDGALEVTRPASHTTVEEYLKWQDEFGSR